MKKKTIIIVSVALAVVLLVGGALIYYFNSPIHALKSRLDDFEEDGMDGLRSHFTDNANETYDTLMKALDNWFVKKVLEWADLDSQVGAFKDNIGDVEWEFVDLLTGSTRADVYLRFNYKDEVSGMVEIRMIKDDGEWKVDGFGIPELDSLDLSELF